MTQKRKRRIVRYEVEVDCMTDFMEKICDGGFKIALYGLNTYLEENGYTKTKMSFKKL